MVQRRCCGACYVYRHYLDTLSAVPLDADDEDTLDLPGRRADTDTATSVNLVTQKEVAAILGAIFADDELVSAALQFAESIEHIMDFTVTRALNTLFSLLNKTVRNVIEYNFQHSDFPLSPERVEQYVTKRLLVSIIWAFSGDANSICVRRWVTSCASKPASIYHPFLPAAL